MAFRIEAMLQGYEYRGVKTGQGKNGTWMSLVLEDPNSYQMEVSVPGDLQADVYGMRLSKGNVLNVPVIAAAGFSNNRSYNYLQLTGLPVIVTDEVAF